MAKTGASRPRRRSAPARPEAVLRGNALATIDEAGRLKLPAGFRRTVSGAWGHELFLTSLLGDCLWVYPLAVWRDKESTILGLSRQHPSVAKFLARVNYFGSETTMDAQGRVVVPAVLRASAGIAGEVAVLGWLDHLEVWSNERFRARLDQEPFTADDHRALAGLGL